MRILKIESNFKPKLESQLGEGAQAKVFKAKFHGQDVAMKYIPLDSVKNGYDYSHLRYGCQEYAEHTIMPFAEKPLGFFFAEKVTEKSVLVKFGISSQIRKKIPYLDQLLYILLRGNTSAFS